MHVHARVDRRALFEPRSSLCERGTFPRAKIFGGSPRSCSTIRALFIPLYRARGLANFDGKKWKGARSIKNFAHSRSRNVDPASYLNEGSKSCPFFFSFLLLRNLRRKAVHPRGRERSASNLSYGRPSCRRAPRE